MARTIRTDTVQVIITVGLDRTGRYRAHVRIAPVTNKVDTVGVGLGVKGAYATEDAAMRAAIPVLEELLRRRMASDEPRPLTISHVRRLPAPDKD